MAETGLFDRVHTIEWIVKISGRSGARVLPTFTEAGCSTLLELRVTLLES
jgi:hypothetical protein